MVCQCCPKWILRCFSPKHPRVSFWPWTLLSKLLISGYFFTFSRSRLPLCDQRRNAERNRCRWIHRTRGVLWKYVRDEVTQFRCRWTRWCQELRWWWKRNNILTLSHCFSPNTQILAISKAFHFDSGVLVSLIRTTELTIAESYLIIIKSLLRDEILYSLQCLRAAEVINMFPIFLAWGDFHRLFMLLNIFQALAESSGQNGDSLLLSLH